MASSNPYHLDVSAPTPVDALRHKVADRSFRAGILGLGYVGFLLAVTIAEAGFEVIGYDINPGGRGGHKWRSPARTVDIADDRVEVLVARSRVTATTDAPAALSDADAGFICVPSPLGARS